VTEIIRWVYLIGSPAAVVFPFYYHWTARWYKSREGRLLMLVSSLPFFLYLSAVIAILLPGEPIKDALRLMLVGLASTVSWALLLVYRKIRKDGMKKIRSRKQEQE
jgi:hypothetical protein